MRRLPPKASWFRLVLPALVIIFLFLPVASAAKITSEEGTKKGESGEDVSFWIKIENNDDQDTTIQVKIVPIDDDFRITPDPEELRVNKGQSGTVVLYVEIPENIDVGIYDLDVEIQRREMEMQDYRSWQTRTFQLEVVEGSSGEETNNDLYLIVGGLALASLALYIAEKKHYALTAFGIIPAHWRLESEQVLDNEVRAAVFEEVRAHNGTSLAQITKHTEYSKSTVRYALRVLLAFNYIVQGPNRYYYLPGHSTSHLSHTQSTILQRLESRELFRQEDLARAVGLSRAGLTHQMETLIRRGDVDRVKKGRNVYYRPSSRTDDSEPRPDHWWENTDNVF